MGVSLALVVIVGLVALSTWWSSRRPVRAPGFQLLRSLLPSWRFFEQVEAGPLLAFRLLTSNEKEFMPVLEAAAGRPSLLLNAAHNLSLLEQSLVEQLLDELDGVEMERAAELTSYRLVQQLVERRARASGAEGGVYQFRIEAEGDDEPLFVSGPHRLPADP